MTVFEYIIGDCKKLTIFEYFIGDSKKLIVFEYIIGDCNKLLPAFEVQLVQEDYIIEINTINRTRNVIILSFSCI